VLAELMMFDLALCHGVTEISCKNFVDCGIIQGGILGDYDVAYRLGQTAFRLLERYRPTPLESSVQFVFGYDPTEFANSLRAIAEGEVDVAPMITGTVGLQDVGTAFDDLADPNQHCKIIASPDL
jgi:hypothetical protein